MQATPKSRGTLAAFLLGLRPERRLTVSEWADANRKLSPRSSAEPGQWRTARAPYLREIMDALSTTSPCEEVVLIKASQLGGTEIGNNWLGYIIDHAPGPAMLVAPNLDMAKRASRQRIQPMIEESPRLRAKIAPARERDSGNTLLSKEFNGGILLMTGAESGAGLRSAPIRYLFCDELDVFPAEIDEEGDPVELAEARTRTFPNRKVFKVSSPTVEGISRISFAYEKSDRRLYQVPCPACNHFQPLRFVNLRWEKGKPETVAYHCEHCRFAIPEYQKTTMLGAGKWIAQNPERGERIRGYHINGLYAPLGWLSWREIAEKWERADADKTKRLLRVFLNTILGETWREMGDAPDWEKLYLRRETYKRNHVPGRALFITAGADVQHDRIEVEIVGWGRGLESWSIDYRVFPGKTETTDGAPWLELAELVGETWAHPSGARLPLRMLAVDSGDNTQTVRAWCRKRPADRVMCILGRDNYPSVVGPPQAVDVTYAGKKHRAGARSWPVGVSLAKSELYGWLRTDAPIKPEETGYPMGWCHFPEYGEEWFQQLCAEQLVASIDKHGYRRTVWQKIRDRNEALDCRVYARAAASVIGIDRWTDSRWRKLEAALGVDSGPAPRQDAPAAGAEPPESPAIPPAKTAKAPTRRKGGYFHRWRDGPKQN